MRIEIADNSYGYLELRDVLLNHGRKRSPRGQETLEIPHVQIVLRNPKRSHPVGIGRKYGKAIVAAEALGLVGGVQDPYLMISAGSNFVRFLEDGGSLHGAYGPRVRGQIQRAVQRLQDDPDTRQAIVQVWDPQYDLADFVPRDLPCTIGFQFAVFDGRLEMRTKMRSNDFFWGWAHDAPMFTALQLTVCNALELEPGPYVHEADSFHMYLRDLAAVEALEGGHTAATNAWPGGGFGYPGLPIDTCMARARAILVGETPPSPTPTEEWYRKTIKPHVIKTQKVRDRLTGPPLMNLP